ncbi:MAG: hypothetical protein RBS17_01740 [Coriobacteriia bacterium]|nr:hypothetical protein [Coriobacteriia bacterium]
MTGPEAFRSLLNSRYDQLYGAVGRFRELLPHTDNDAAVHSGEEGRFVETLLAQFLEESLPARVAVGTGFVVDLELEVCSSQIDIIVYDRQEYVPYLRYGSAVVVPREAVLAAISVKKNLRYADIAPELQALGEIGSLCGMTGLGRPYLCLLGFDAKTGRDIPAVAQTVFGHIQSAYPERQSRYSTNELVDAIIVLDKFYIRKTKWRGDQEDEQRAGVPYMWTGGNTVNRNQYLQELLHGIEFCLNEGRKNAGPPAKMTHFPQVGMAEIGVLPVCCEDRPFGRRD